jgi:hypothetical protein
MLGDIHLRHLYPPIEPYDSGMLDVGDGHGEFCCLARVTV